MTARTKKPSLKVLSERPEDPETAGPGRPLCVECGLDKETTRPYTRPTPPSSVDLVLIGEAPGEREEREGRYFVGKAGQVVRGFLVDEGFDPERVLFLNANRCRPKDNGTPTMKQIRCCRPFLLAELAKYPGVPAIALGTTAARAVTNDGGVNVKTLRGRVVEIPGLPDENS